MRKQLGSERRIITATEMRRDFSVVVRRLNKRREHALIQSKGAPVLLSVAEYDELMRYKRLMVFDKFTREFGREIEKQGLSEEEIMVELEETKQEVFRERYAKSRNQKIIALEQQHAQGYANHPSRKDEFTEWESEQVWDES